MAYACVSGVVEVFNSLYCMFLLTYQEELIMAPRKSVISADICVKFTFVAGRLLVSSLTSLASIAIIV